MILTIKTKIASDALKHASVDVRSVAKSEHLKKLTPAVMEYLQHKEKEVPGGLEVESGIVVLTPATLGRILEALKEIRHKEPAVAAAIELLINAS